MDCHEQSIDIEIAVEYYYDPESRNWGFTVPSLHIIGGGATREEAERLAAEAIAFTLKDGATEGTVHDTDAGTVRVTVHVGQ